VDPSNYIGSPSENIWYSIALTKDIKKDNGDSAFQGVVGSIAYEWSFELSTIIDITPPQIIDVIPEPNNTYARNIVVQINFNEAVDPLLSSGETINGFTNIEVQDLGSGLNIEGAFYISNQYKTVEFLTTDACGVNSCGGTIYCLPGNANVQSLIKAADLASFLGGIADMADNSLDGNADGTAQGPVSDCDLAGLPDRPTCLADGDNAFWQFSTNNTIDLTPPKIEEILPASGQSAVSLSAVPEAIFSKYLLSATLNTTNIIMSSDPVHLFNHWIGKNNDTVLGRTSAYIYHDQFEEDTDYAPLFFSEILDVYQNCYNPAAGPGCAPNPPSQPYCCPNPSLPGSFILSASSCP
ncbi:Ig-like domain-containing protein, partial [Candidatus Parcubacteria bacterium]|nr:Ig-like domain-containing protein [Candidatus Parcubacteria bacterium]